MASAKFTITVRRTRWLKSAKPFVVLDTPGVTDTNHRAAEIATAALSLAPIKLLVIARDQLRAASNLQIATRIDGAVCIPVISSVEPEESQEGTAAGIQLRNDLRTLREQLHLRAPNVRWVSEVLVPDFEITGNEAASSTSFVGQLIDRLSGLELNELSLASARDARSGLGAAAFAFRSGEANRR